MFINDILTYLHKYTDKVYENSLILQNISSIVYLLILSTFLLSTFVNSDIIGYIAIVIFVLTIVQILFKPDDSLQPKKFEIFLIAYFMILLVALAGSSFLMLSLKGFMKTLIYLGFYMSVVHHLKSNKHHIIPILVAIALCSSFESIIGISQNFAKVDEISGWQDVSNLNPEEVITRVYGTLLPLNPNLLGGYLVMAIPSIIGLAGYFFHSKKYVISGLFVIFGLLSSATLFLTGCRGGYLGFFTILLVMFLVSLKLYWNRYKKIYIALTSIISGLGIAFIMVCTPLRVRLFSIFAMRNDSSNSFRFNVYKSSFQMFKDNYLLGIGHGNQNFREVYGLYMKTGFDALSAYNIYLETAVEAGIFALISFIGFLFSILYDSVMYIKNNNDVQKIILVSIPLMSIFGTLVHGMVDTVFFRPQLQIVFWSMCAILSNQVYSERDMI